MSLVEKQQLKNDKAALAFEAFVLIFMFIAILCLSAWFREGEYIIGIGIGVLFTTYTFFIYFRWERLK